MQVQYMVIKPHLWVSGVVLVVTTVAIHEKPYHSFKYQ